MSDLSAADRQSVFGHADRDWRGRTAPARREESGGLSAGWVIGGVAVLALGFLAWRHFGPDFRRYIKMERM